MQITKRVFIASLFLFSALSFAVQEPSLREKIGQMLIVGFDGTTADEQSLVARYINEDNIGGVILFDYNFKTQTYNKNIVSPEQVSALNKQLQLITKKANKRSHRPQAPLFISVDYEGGRVNRLHPRYGFPQILSAQDIGKGSLSEAQEQAELMANTLHSAGFNVDYAPDIDVNVNPDNPIIGKLGRSFSENPNKVSKYGSIYTQAFLQKGVDCAYKHFPGHGSSTEDSHLGFVDITNTWSTDELIPFLQLIAQPKQCGMVMVAHVVNRQLDPSGAPATLSAPMISGILRHDLHFDGVVITDDMQMKAISDYYGLESALTQAINAGADVFIFGNQLVEQPQDPKELIDIIEAKVQSGEISTQRIDEAYRRIMRMKDSL